jgi:hypothetical protein
MEKQCHLGDPKEMSTHADCATLGLMGCVTFVHEEHGQLISDRDWPVLATKLSAANHTKQDGEDPNHEDLTLTWCSCEGKGHKG